MQKNIPNFLTCLRVLLIPIVVAIFYLNSEISYYIIIIIFLFASITDFFDGFLARLWKAQSNLGKILDPIADKLLIISTLTMMVYKGIAPVLPTLLIVCREVLVSGMREYLAEKRRKKKSFSVNIFAKVKTAVQMISIILLLIEQKMVLLSPTSLIGVISIWVAAIITIITGCEYFRLNLVEGKRSDK